jgi:hypothetical protein
MKKILLFIFSLSVFSIIAQDTLYKMHLPLNDENKIEFIEIVEMPNKSQADLYTLCKGWIVENYNSANAVIQMDDKEAGKLIAKGFYEYHKEMTFSCGTYQRVSHIIKLFTKDSKVRISLSNLISDVDYKNPVTNKMENLTQPFEEIIIDKLYKPNGKPDKCNAKDKEEIIKFWIKTKESVKDYLNKATNDDDW